MPIIFIVILFISFAQIFFCCFTILNGLLNPTEDIVEPVEEERQPTRELYLISNNNLLDEQNINESRISLNVSESPPKYELPPNYSESVSIQNELFVYLR